MTKLEQFTLPYLIVVEGPGDAAFFRHLITTRAIPEEFHVLCPTDAGGVSGSGNTRFGNALDGFAVTSGFDALRGILIVTDSDENEAKSFQSIQNQIRSTTKKHKAPTAPLQKTNGNPPIVVMMIPWVGQIGNLETLCVSAAETTFPAAAACADAFQICTGVDQWPDSKRSKVKLRSIISATYRRNSDIGLAYLWDDFPDSVPLGNPCFDQIAEFLKSFGTFINAP